MYLYWIWSAILLLANVLPFGEAVNKAPELGGYFRLDYVLHCLGCMALPLTLVFLPYKNPKPRKYIAWLLLWVMVLVISLEVIQIFIPYRTYNVLDLASNVLGALVGSILLISIRLIYARILLPRLSS